MKLIQFFKKMFSSAMSIFVGKPKLNKKAIETINGLHAKGHTIKILTARYMGRNNDNIKKANIQGYKKTLKQLKKWGLKFHKLFLNKPSSDIYIDDKSYGYDNKWKQKFKSYL